MSTSINSFSSKTIEALKYYVYIYSDPDTHKPFYVGKGKENRAFAHLSLEGESAKINKIKEIRSRGKEPIIEILIHGVEEEVALKVEAAAIDLIGIENLTNEQRGHHSSTYGKIDVNLLEARYSCEELNSEDISENLLLIRVNQLYQNDMTPSQLYDITRGFWKVSKERAQKMQYALSIYDGMVLEVYSISQWFPAGTTMLTNRYTGETEEQLKGRFEFVGNIAVDSIRSKYIGKSVSQLFKKGDQNPIKYIEKGENIN